VGLPTDDDDGTLAGPGGGHVRAIPDRTFTRGTEVRRAMQMHEQGTAQWHAQRIGCVTASRFGDVIGAAKPNKNKIVPGFSVAAETYAKQILAEMLSKLPSVASAPAMEWGHKYEPMARREYEQARGVTVGQCVFFEALDWIGGSADGGVTTEEETGIIEIKCPYSTAEHLDTLLAAEPPKEYLPQMQGNMWVMGAEWCDYISFDPRLPDDCRLFVYRVLRERDYIDEMVSKLTAFRDLVQAKYAEITGREQFTLTTADIQRIDDYINAKSWERIGMFYEGGQDDSDE
jgi:putative phage-type endonuclease